MNKHGCCESKEGSKAHTPAVFEQSNTCQRGYSSESAPRTGHHSGELRIRENQLGMTVAVLCRLRCGEPSFGGLTKQMHYYRPEELIEHQFKSDEISKEGQDDKVQFLGRNSIDRACRSLISSPEWFVPSPPNPHQVLSHGSLDSS
jgi:hypothetical protein